MPISCVRCVRVRQHPEDADRREHQGQRRTRRATASEPWLRDHSAASAAIVCTSFSGIAIERVHLRPHGGRERGAGHAAPYDERDPAQPRGHEIRVELRVGKIHLGTRVLARPDVPDIGHHADDHAPRLRRCRVAFLEPLAHGRLPRPVLARERLVHDGDRLRAFAIGGGEEAAGLQRDAECREVVGRHPARAGDRLVGASCESLDAESVFDILTAERQRRRRTRAFDARRGRQLLREASRKRNQLRRALVARPQHDDGECELLVHLKAGVHVDQPHETAKREPRADEQPPIATSATTSAPRSVWR